jgi:hypothetical protein
MSVGTRSSASKGAWFVSLALVVLGPGRAFAVGAAPEAATESREDPVTNYVDRSSDGLTSIEIPGTSAPSLTSVEVATPKTEAEPAAKPAEWLLVPIPGYNPTLGFSVTGMGAYIFPADAASPPSTVGGFGMYSTNNSWAFGSVAKLNVAEDRGQFVPISQHMGGGRLESLFRLVQGLYLGPRWTLLKMRSTADLSQVEIPPDMVPPSNELVSWFSAPGIKLQWDTRDSQFFPRRGQLMEVTADFHLKALGDSFDYVQSKLAWNQYLSLSPCMVLAFREVISFVTGDAPFYALPRLGQGSDIRGFKAGEYQDNILVAVQMEYRIQFLSWLGAVAFFGVGEVQPNVESLSFKDLLPAGGVGARVTIAAANHVNFRADVAFSREGVTFYFGVGEAF